MAVAGCNHIFNNLLPAGSNSVCEKEPRVLPLRYGRQHSHHPPWLRCSLGQSWKIPGGGQREVGQDRKAFVVHAHMWDKLNFIKFKCS